MIILSLLYWRFYDFCTELGYLFRQWVLFVLLLALSYGLRRCQHPGMFCSFVQLFSVFYLLLLHLSCSSVFRLEKPRSISGNFSVEIVCYIGTFFFRPEILISALSCHFYFHIHIFPLHVPIHCCRFILWRSSPPLWCLCPFRRSFWLFWWYDDIYALMN